MTESVLLGVIEFQEAKRIQAVLSGRGIKVILLQPSLSEPNCGPVSCGPSAVEVYVSSEDLVAVREFFEEEKKRNQGDLKPVDDMDSFIYDPAQAIARCPACGESFSTDKAECPECGLCFV